MKSPFDQKALFSGAMGGCIVVMLSTLVYWKVGAQTFWDVWQASSGWAAASIAAIIGWTTLVPIKNQQAQQMALIKIDLLQKELEHSDAMLNHLINVGSFIRFVCLLSQSRDDTAKDMAAAISHYFGSESDEYVADFRNFTKSFTRYLLYGHSFTTYEAKEMIDMNDEFCKSIAIFNRFIVMSDVEIENNIDEIHFLSSEIVKKFDDVFSECSAMAGDAYAKLAITKGVFRQ